jgi:hypothetical protein
MMTLLAVLLAATPQSASPPAVDPGDENPYAATFAAEGTLADTFVYMHNRKGVRIELDVDKGTLDLWISPRAGESLDYRDRNFSNREDHTSIFDRIELPHLTRAAFTGCDYDAFHSVVHYGAQALHVATPWDRPVVLLWFERPAVVHLKSDKQDTPVERRETLFEVEHTDRGRAFRFVAALGAGKGRIEHQRDVDAGRSTWARVRLAPGQTLALAGELLGEPVAAWAREAAGADRSALRERTEEKVREALSRGRIRLAGRPEMQKVLDVNRRTILSMQDESGAIRAAIKYIYYLIWVRDGALVAGSLARAGLEDPLERWSAFLLANPTVREEEPSGRFFGQLVDGRITKWEEDGLFWAVWSAFTHLTQTGDRRFASGESLAVLRDAADWLERYAFDRERGLFGRYHYGETPLTGSRGDGWDDAVGRPTDSLRTEYEGSVIVRSYDLAVNLQAWGTYLMMAAMDEEKAEEWLGKARALEERLGPWLGEGRDLPDYGDLLTEDGRIVRAGPFGLDAGDYVWALALTPFAGEAFGLAPVREKLLEAPAETAGETFLATHFSLLAGLDPEMHGEARILAAMDRVVPAAVRAGRYLPMAYTVPEVAGIADGHPYHDVRPQAFAAAPWIWAVANLGLRRLPFGIAVRATSALEGIDAYEYRGALVDVAFEGSGDVREVRLDGEPIVHTLQLPESRLAPGPHRLVVAQGARSADAGPLLASSTVRLDDVRSLDASVTYDVRAFGENVLVFRGPVEVGVRDGAGRAVPTRSRTIRGHSYVRFDGRGRFRVSAAEALAHAAVGPRGGRR